MSSRVYYMNARSASIETGLVPKMLARRGRAPWGRAGLDEEGRAR